MIKNLPLYLFLLWASWLSAQINEVIHEPPVAEPDYSGEKTRFGRYRTGMPQHVNEGYKTGWALDDSLLVPIQFYKMPNTYSDFMVVHNYEGAWGVIDKRGRTVLPFEYDQGGQLYVWRNGDPVCFLSKNGRQQFFDQQGKALFETQFEALDLEATNRLNLKYANGWLVATKMDPVLGEVSAIANRSGQLLFPFKYYRIAWATPHLIGVTEGREGKTGVRDWNDREILPLEYMEVAPPDVNGWLSVSLTVDKKGLIDTAGQILIPVEYQECNRRYDVSAFYDLKKGAFYGLADRQGRVIIPPDAPKQPSPVQYHTIRWERDSFGLRMVRKEQARGTYWIQNVSQNESALYHIERGLLFKGAFTNVQIMDEQGPILVYLRNGKQQLFNLEGRDILGGERSFITANEFRTCIFAHTGHNYFQIHAMNGSLTVDEVFHTPGSGAGALPSGFFAVPDQQDRYALFDPFGKRLTEHRFYHFKAPDSDENKIAREKGMLRPGRRIVAKGMADVPARQVMTFLWIDDTGMIVNE